MYAVLIYAIPATSRVSDTNNVDVSSELVNKENVEIVEGREVNPPPPPPPPPEAPAKTPPI
jgi:hypothetical protein